MISEWMFLLVIRYQLNINLGSDPLSIVGVRENWLGIFGWIFWVTSYECYFIPKDIEESERSND